MKETELPEGNLYITGTWDNFSEFHLVDAREDGTYHFDARLGETLMERFYFALEKNRDMCVVPVTKNAGMDIRSEGPVPYEGNTWLIDAREENWPEGSRIHISITPDSKTGIRRVAWERIRET